MQETWVQSLSQEYPLEKEMTTHSSILAWVILWTEEPGRLQSMGSQRGGHDLITQQRQSYSNGMLKIYCHITIKLSNNNKKDILGTFQPAMLHSIINQLNISEIKVFWQVQYVE